MNIFYLNHDVNKCAKQHVDRHVVKMILEYTQLLCTAHRVCDGEPTPAVSRSGRKTTRYVLPDERETTFYHATHIHHPSTVWTRASRNNYKWLHMLLTALAKEYTYRYGRKHKLMSDGLIEALKHPPVNIADAGFTEPTPAMPDEFKTPHDSVASYRKYYKYGKNHLAVWTKRPIPEWWSTI